MTPRHIVVAMNPRASFGKNQDAGHEVARVLASAGHDVIALREEDYRALENVTRDALRPESVLVVVGGDGMVHMGVHLARGKNVPLGLVPAGTGNDLARHLGLPLGSISWPRSCAATLSQVRGRDRHAQMVERGHQR